MGEATNTIIDKPISFSISACPAPQWYYIDVGNICNLKCPYCPTGNGKIPVSDKGMMSREAFDCILRKIETHAKFVSLFNWGEPFLNKNLLYMICALQERGIDTHLDSNLSLRDFSADEAEQIVRSGLFSLFASIDGISQESYERYRVGGNAQRALENLRRLVEARERLQSATPGLLWAFYLNRFNEHEVERARALAKEIGVEIWFKLLSCPEEFQTSYVKTDPNIFVPPASMRPLHPHQVNRFLPEFALHPALPPICRQPFTVGVINWDGEVFPCCVVSGKQFSLGNLLEQELEEIWNGPQVVSCRKFLSNFGPIQGGDSICECECTAVPSHL